MLVLTRKPGETILVGDIEITVAEIHRGKVRLGIVAPKSIKILRKELLNKPPTEGERE